MKEFKSIQIGDLIAIPGRFWRVIGVHVGGMNQESVVEASVVDREGPVAHGKSMDKIFIPIDLITPSMVYRKVDHEAERAFDEAGGSHVEINPATIMKKADRSIPRHSEQPVDKPN